MRRLGHIAAVLALSLTLLGSALADGGHDHGTDVDTSWSESEESLELSEDEWAALEQSLETSEHEADEETALMTLLSEELDESAIETDSFDATHALDEFHEFENDESWFEKNNFFALEDDKAFSLVQITAINSAESKSIVASSSEEGATSSTHEIDALSEVDTESSDSTEVYTLSTSLLDLLDSSSSASESSQEFAANEAAEAAESLDIDAFSESEEFEESVDGWGVFGPSFFRHVGSSFISRVVGSIFD